MIRIIKIDLHPWEQLPENPCYKYTVYWYNTIVDYRADKISSKVFSNKKKALEFAKDHVYKKFPGPYIERTIIDKKLFIPTTAIEPAKIKKYIIRTKLR